MDQRDDQRGAEWDEGTTALEIRNYEDGEEVITEGVQSDSFFVILTGKVRISRRGQRMSILGAGDVFGLENCLLETSSSITARAMEKARVATYGSEAFDFILFEAPQTARRLFVSLLKQLTETTRVAVQGDTLFPGDVNVRFYEDGEVIMAENSRETEIFRLVSTELGLRVTRNGQEIDIIRNPGEFFGELAGVLQQERSATVTSMGKSVVQVYSAEHIQDMIEEHPEIAKRMITTLSKRLSSAIKKIVRLQGDLRTAQRPV
jgi:CRP-like cAMP-binding protein